MLQLFRNRYFLLFSVIYVSAVAVLTAVFHQSVADAAVIFIFFGIVFPILAWLFTKAETVTPAEKPSFKLELPVILFLILFFLWYATSGTAQINRLIPDSISNIAWKNEVVVLIRKLFVFVLIPFLIYKSAGFTLRDFGFFPGPKKIFAKRSFLAFGILSFSILLFQYFLSGGAQPVRNGDFTLLQLITGLPLLFFWLLLEVGLVEEFFFRAVLQSRIAILLRSPVAGILISGLIFGLAHAPGLYFRGAETEGISDQLPFAFWAVFTISYMSLAGIFLGIIWYRTKNIWLIMALHAMVDLLPNFSEFILTWHL